MLLCLKSEVCNTRISLNIFTHSFVAKFQHVKPVIRCSWYIGWATVAIETIAEWVLH